MICQACGVDAPTKYVAFYQNIGALVIRFSRSVQGELCKNCIHKNFWQYTLINCTLGWWGVVSLIVTPFFILNNTCRYLFCLGMESVPPGAAAPKLSDEEIERLTPHMTDAFERLSQGQELQEVAEDVANRADVSPGQVILFIRAILAAHQDEPDSGDGT